MPPRGGPRTPSPGGATAANALGPLVDGVNQLLQACLDYRKLELQEVTQRQRIAADLQTRIASIRLQRELLSEALAATVAHRAAGLDAQIRALDEAVAARDPALVKVVVDAMVSTLEQSPLRDLGQLHRQLEGDDGDFVLRL